MSNPKPSRWIALFEEFIKDLRIASKEVVSTDERGVPLSLWHSQRIVLDAIGRGLDDDIRKFYVLKSRQLGVTTITLAIDLFWMAMHRDLTGALVTDTEQNRDANRMILSRFFESFPPDYFGDDFRITKHNRQFMAFSNGSRFDFLIAGTQKKGVSWAEGRGYAMMHLTECSKYGSPEGLDSLEESFAQANPNRLAIYESTANGPNHWKRRYEDARDDLYSKRSCFVGWWAGDFNVIQRSDPRYLQYGTYPATNDERERLKLIKNRYDVKITPEQLAWVRWKDATADDQQMLKQNQPWLPEEAFIVSGYSFFQVRQLGKDINAIDADPERYGFIGYRYELGNDFFSIKMVVEEEDLDAVELRVWEEPKEGAWYVIGADPAWGRSDHKDRHAASVWRCFADKLVQVAEYATADVEPKHFAWVLAHLAGAYRQCIVNVEINGPGRMIMQEWDHVRGMLNADMYREEVRSRDWEDALGYARWYLYHRPDSMGAGYAANFECLALDTPLPTPTGWTTMGEVREGDLLLSDTGAPTIVIGVSDIKTGAKCFELTFDDGTQIVADEDHWWRAARRHWSDGDKMRQTKDLEAGKFYIRQADALALPAADLPLDPYLLGAWLGDGSSSAAVIHSGDQDVEETVANIEACGQTTTRSRTGRGWRVGLNDGRAPTRHRPNAFLAALRALNVFENKHIPAAYLRGGYEQRLSLLQGLMDTDGSASGNGGAQCSYVTTSPALASGFAELVRSLGFKAKYLTWDESPAKGVKCALRYQFWFTPPTGMRVFRLRRKQDRVDRSPRKSSTRQCHRIQSIREVESVPVRCVMVDAPSSMFLAGAGMIPTHNSTWKTKQEIMFQFRGSYVTNELYVRSRKLLEEMVNVIHNDGTIGAPDSSNEDGKDDRVFAGALGNRAWLNWLRPGMIANGETYDLMTRAESGERPRQTQRVMSQVYAFFKRQEEIAANPELYMTTNQRFLNDRGLE